MPKNKQPIGVMDSGVGGLTVVRQLQRLLPGEDIVYIGDSANCPYGNRAMDDICALSVLMLRRLAEQDVKCVAIACNTISTLAVRLRPEFSFPIVSIVESGVDYVVREKLPRVGLLATEFTVSTGAYDRLIRADAPDCKIVSKGSPLLAALIDRGDFDRKAIDAEIKLQVGDILAREPVEDLLLACTHFPLAEENFRRCFPALRLIDPAAAQAAAVRDLLAVRDMINPQQRGTLTLATTGDGAVYDAVAARLGLSVSGECEVISL